MTRDSAVTLSYMDGKEYSIKPIRWLLKPISIWPVTDSSIKERILSDFLLLVCVFLIVGTLVPCALGIFLDETKDMETKLREFGPLSNWVLASLKYCSLLLHVDDIGCCIKHIEADWQHAGARAEDRNVMLRNARIGRFIAISSAMFMHSGVFSYNIFRGITTDESVSVLNNVSMHTLPFAFYNKILDTTTTPAYEIVFAMQYLSTFVVNSVAVSACSLTAVFVMHACGQLKILISLLENLTEQSEKTNSTQPKFAIIVEHHLRVLSFVSRIEKITSVVCLIEIVGCTIQMCLLGTYTIMDWNQGDKQNIVAYSIILISVTFNIFIFCCIGEILSEQCGQIGETAYMIDWYLLPGNTALGLVLIILKSSTVVKITAGKMIELSLSTFGNVVKSALAYLNILRNFIT